MRFPPDAFLALGIIAVAAIAVPVTIASRGDYPKVHRPTYAVPADLKCPEKRHFDKKGDGWTVSFHEVKTLADGTTVGILGSRMYLIGPYRQIASCAYSMIHRTNDGYVAYKGSQKIYLDRRGRAS